MAYGLASNANPKEAYPHRPDSLLWAAYWARWISYLAVVVAWCYFGPSLLLCWGVAPTMMLLGYKTDFPVRCCLLNLYLSCWRWLGLVDHSALDESTQICASSILQCLDCAIGVLGWLVGREWAVARATHSWILITAAVLRLMCLSLFHLDVTEVFLRYCAIG